MAFSKSLKKAFILVIYLDNVCNDAILLKAIMTFRAFKVPILFQAGQAESATWILFYTLSSLYLCLMLIDTINLKYLHLSYIAAKKITLPHIITDKLTNEAFLLIINTILTHYIHQI